MFVVPVAGDKITTKDVSDPAVVSSFTSLKDEPAVYVVPTTSKEKYIYFSDIVEINGVRVEYKPDVKLFAALGPLKRKYNIPQPKDTLIVKLKNVQYGEEETEEIEVKKVQLHSKKHGIGRGLLACGSESCFSLKDIIDIRRHGWTEKFHAEKFRHYYLDYGPLGIKVKG